MVGWGILVTHLQREGVVRRGLEGGTWVLVPVLVVESVVMGQRGGVARHWWPRVGCQWWDRVCGGTVGCTGLQRGTPWC